MDEISDQMDEQAARYQAQDAQNMADAYAEEGQSGWSDGSDSEPAFGEPMDDPSGSY